MDVKLIGTLFGLFILFILIFRFSMQHGKRKGWQYPQVLQTITWNNLPIRGFKFTGRLIGILLLLTVSLGSANIPAAAANAQTELAQLAVLQPNEMVGVIVQKAVQGSAAEVLASRLGGTITRDLSMINAFAAEMPAGAALTLSRDYSVRWVSLDTEMQETGVSGGFTTWATGVSNRIVNTFYNAGAAVDSELGPNETYASGSRAVGAFTGFTAEETPGHKISKVEIAVRLYTNRQFSSWQNPIFYINVNGESSSPIVLNTYTFAQCIGQANACTLYLDVTGVRSWSWGDFASPIDVTIDQRRLRYAPPIYYDAIGLKVSTFMGVDGSDSASDTLVAPIEDVNANRLLNAYNQAVRVTETWSENGLRGEGMTVAVVDSGVAKTRDLYTHLVKAVNFNGKFHSASDRFGHGTFVASVIAGDGKFNNSYMGIAPKAKLINVRVSDDKGVALESDVVAALQWVLENKEQYNIRVVNLSLNSSTAQSYLTSPLDAAVEILWFNGIVVVASAGNNGSGTLYPPANDPFVITVGAVDDNGTADLSDDMVASFSAYGVTEDGFPKPDLVAPGKNIVAHLPNNAKLTIGKDHPDHQVNNEYFRMSGTSVSAPMVTGAAVLLLQDEPGLTPDQVKYRLMASAAKTDLWPGYDEASAGAGYLDIYAAINGETSESANTGLAPSGLLLTGTEPVNSSVSWNSVSWNSVSWNSVSWNSVSWNSVSWNSVSWNSDYWGD